MMKKRLFFALGLFAAVILMAGNSVAALSDSALLPNNSDYYEDYESYGVGTKLTDMPGVSVFGSSDEKVAVDPEDPNNKVLHFRVSNRMQFEFSDVVTRNFTVSYRFYALSRVEWIGLNVRRQNKGPGAFYDTMKSYFNLIRIGYTDRQTDNQTIRFSPQYYNRSALTYLDNEHPTTEYRFDSAYNAWHSVVIRYADRHIYADLDGQPLFDYEDEIGIDLAGYVSLAVQAGDVMIDDLRITTEDKYAVRVESESDAGSAKANRSTASENSEIVLTAQPNAGFEFAGWYEGDVLLSEESVFTVPGPTNSDRTFRAAWRTGSYRVTLGSADPGRGYQTVTDDSGAGGEIFEALTPLTAVAISMPGYMFAAWYSGGEIISTENPYRFRMPLGDYELTAKYVPEGTSVHTLSVRSETKGCSSPSGTDAVSEGGSASGGGTFCATLEVTLTALPADRYSFDGWYVGEEKVSEEPRLTVTVSGDAEYTARFVDRLYLVTLVNGAEETATEYRLLYGSRFTAAPTRAAEGYAFRDWYAENVTPEITADGKATFLVTDDNIYIRANYRKNVHAVTVTTTVKGMGATGGGNREFGETVRITPVKSDQYRVRGYRVTGATGVVGEDGALTFVMPDGEVSVEIQFSPVPSTPLGREIVGRCLAGAIVLAAAALIALRGKKKE